MPFNWVAETYFDNSTFQYEHAHSVLKHYEFKGNEAVLDVGCGDGKITSDIANLLDGGSVLGIDSSPSMIEFAKSEFASGTSNLQFKVGRAEQLDYQEQFDLVVSFACLQWVSEPGQLAFLMGTKQSLRKQGKVIITLYPKHHYIWDSIEETVQDKFWSRFFKNYKNPHTSYTISSYKHLVHKAGLDIKSITESVPVAYFDTCQEMQDFVRSWLPHTDRVAPELRNKFISAISDRFMDKITVNKNSGIGMPFRRLDIVLVKQD